MATVQVTDMKKPTLEQIAAYCSERGNGIDPEQWFDYYEMVGWVVGKCRKPMKDWKAAIRTWERQGKRYRSESRQQAKTWSTEQEAAAVGVQARPGETWEQFTCRVRAAMTRH